MNPRWVVFKFGGTSVASPRALRRAAAVIASAYRAQRVAVVVSALAGVTSALDAAGSRSTRGEGVASAVVGRLRRQHRRLLHVVARNEAHDAALALEPVLQGLHRRLEHATRTRNLIPLSRAEVLAAGERLSVHLFAAVLRERGVPAAASDATRWLVASGEPLEAEPDMAASRERTANALLTISGVPVITGFLAGSVAGSVALLSNGNRASETTARAEHEPATVLLGRGGSDLSATLLAATLDAERVEIFTDTRGVRTGDPRLVPHSRVHRTLTPTCASRLARLGAKVLHPRTLEPLLALRIPLLVRDTFHLESAGTTIAFGTPARAAEFENGRRSRATGSERTQPSVVSGASLVRVGSDAGTAPARLAALLRAHEVPVLRSLLDDSLLMPATALACVRATGVQGLRFTPGPFDGRLVAVVSAHQAVAPEFVGRALTAAGVFPLAPPARALPGVTATVVAAADVPAATRALHRATVREHAARVDVVLAGARGRVGRALLARLSREVRSHERRPPRLRLVAAFDTRGHVADPHGLDPRFVARRLEHASPRPLAAILSGLRGEREPLLFVDCTASETVAARHASLLARGIGVVTANKHGLAGPLDDWLRLRQAAQRTPLRASTTVGAGLPVLSTVRSLRQRGDALVSVRATLSGTLAHVLAAVHHGMPLSRAVADAHRLGLTEPNPAADLSGADVARKLVILLREAGVFVEPGDIQMEPWVNARALLAPDARALCLALEADDATFAARVSAVRAAGRRLVFAATYDGAQARAGLLEVDQHEALAVARPGENVIQLRTALHDRVPLVIAGPGAGVAVTAAGLHGDMLSAARSLLARSRRGHDRAGAFHDLARAGSARHHPAWA